MSQQLQLASEFESDLQDSVEWGKEWLVDFNTGKTQLVSFDRSNKTGSIDVKMYGSVLEEKPSFKMLGLTFSSKLDWGSYIIFIVLWSFFLQRFLCISANPPLPCMEYCCHVWAVARSWYLELLEKLQKRICRTVGPSLAGSLEPLPHRRNVASLSFFNRYYFDRFSSELIFLSQMTLLRWLPFLFGSQTVILIVLLFWFIYFFWS